MCASQKDRTSHTPKNTAHSTRLTSGYMCTQHTQHTCTLYPNAPNKVLHRADETGPHLIVLLRVGQLRGSCLWGGKGVTKGVVIRQRSPGTGTRDRQQGTPRRWSRCTSETEGASRATVRKPQHAGHVWHTGTWGRGSVGYLALMSQSQSPVSTRKGQLIICKTAAQRHVCTSHAL